MLEHLILSPSGGLCNRLRAIAAGRRICQRTGASFTLVWDWGDFWEFFAPLPDVIVRRFSPICAPRSQRLNRQLEHERTVDVRQRRAKIRSGVIFWGNDEPRLFLPDIVPQIPQPHARLASIVDAYAREKLEGAVGFHMRRTDNKISIRHSPDHLFVAEAERVIDQGRKIFLATDNIETESMMIARFGNRILMFPRRKILAQRWPRPAFDPVALNDDLCDLLLLARTEYVIGSHYSSFSGLAMALNGSPLCRKLVLPDSRQAA